MVAVQKAYEAKGFTFIGIAVNETEPSVKSFIKSKGITYPVLMATPALVGAFNRYVDGGITGIPTSFVVDSSGNLTDAMVGPRSKEMFEKIINTSISRKPGK
jgi:peroxiredoxin